MNLKNHKALAMAFRGITGNDITLFNRIARQQGVTWTKLLADNVLDTKQLHISLQKLMGSRFTCQSSRYLLIKQAPTHKGIGYFLTTKGEQYAALFRTYQGHPIQRYA